jgi:hypothetical protein
VGNGLKLGQDSGSLARRKLPFKGAEAWSKGLSLASRAGALVKEREPAQSAQGGRKSSGPLKGADV